MKTTNVRNTKENRWIDYEITYECDDFSPSEWLTIMNGRKADSKENYRTWEAEVK